MVKLRRKKKRAVIRVKVAAVTVTTSINRNDVDEDCENVYDEENGNIDTVDGNIEDNDADGGA